jgi:hypothetical protein
MMSRPSLRFWPTGDVDKIRGLSNREANAMFSTELRKVSGVLARLAEGSQISEHFEIADGINTPCLSS